MGYGVSIWRMNPKQSHLSPGAKECKLCIEAAVDEDGLCVEHQEGGHTPPKPKPEELPRKKKKKRKRKKSVKKKGSLFTQVELDWLDKVIRESKEQRKSDQSDDSSA